MFKEVVSLAIILGFIWNILYIDHPDTRSYTIAFVGSLIVLSPFVLGWIYWGELRKGATAYEILTWRYWRQTRNRAVRLGLMSDMRNPSQHGSVSDVEDCSESRASADVEMGLGLGSSAENGEP
ncbi:hypothetical protein ONS95_006634 [Cadophora gregata]|uniref:uncharacterized protein n=1 Tax=Cadophora gregata TaxID=51156 RepID=UPI0026DB53DF|nr:uncharacterized protein ONS95_006634 [Cadophora gregata]KAK0101462.1 hypothetical protein ONS95_006634 [Cadophora gregata]KAK0106529.1 hypothetical protein ONS96_004151 [Cadophora gregata f. sp. sojae]